MPFYGVYDFTDRKGLWRGSLLRRMLERHIMKRRIAEHREAFERASPMSRVHAGAPPFFVVHGTLDTLVPVEDARAFVEMLREVSREPVGYAEIPGAQHSVETFPSARTGAVIRGVERFLWWVYARHLAGRERARPVRVAVGAEAVAVAPGEVGVAPGEAPFAPAAAPSLSPRRASSAAAR